MRSLIPYVDIMKISDEEIELLTGYQNMMEAVEELYRQGVKIVAVTLGGNGAYIYNKEGGCPVIWIIGNNASLILCSFYRIECGISRWLFCK